jgi:hypothetical protein
VACSASEIRQLNLFIPFMALEIYTEVRKARPRQRLWLLAAASIWLLAVPAQALPEAPIPTFSAAYKVRYGLLRGTMTLELKQTETAYSYATSLRPTGIVSWFKSGVISERTTLQNIDGTVRPLDYFSEDTIANPVRETTYTFDRHSGRVTGKYKAELVDAPLRDGGHNRISVHVALILALRSGMEISDFSVFDRGRWKNYQFEVINNQPVETPMGNFETVEIRYSSPGDDRSWSLHFAPVLEYHPVMIVFRNGGKVKSRAQLTDYRIGE